MSGGNHLTVIKHLLRIGDGDTSLVEMAAWAALELTISVGLKNPRTSLPTLFSLVEDARGVIEQDFLHAAWGGERFQKEADRAFESLKVVDNFLAARTLELGSVVEDMVPPPDELSAFLDRRKFVTLARKGEKEIGPLSEAGGFLRALSGVVAREPFGPEVFRDVEVGAGWFNEREYPQELHSGLIVSPKEAGRMIERVRLYGKRLLNLNIP